MTCISVSRTGAWSFGQWFAITGTTASAEAQLRWDAASEQYAYQPPTQGGRHHVGSLGGLYTTAVHVRPSHATYLCLRRKARPYHSTPDHATVLTAVRQRWWDAGVTSQMVLVSDELGSRHNVH